METLIVPTIDPAYDLATISTWQQAMVPYLKYWHRMLWSGFIFMLAWQLMVYVVFPNIKRS